MRIALHDAAAELQLVFHKWYGIVFGAKVGKPKLFLGANL